MPNKKEKTGGALWMQPSGDSRWQEEKQLQLRRRKEKRKTEEVFYADIYRIQRGTH